MLTKKKKYIYTYFKIMQKINGAFFEPTNGQLIFPVFQWKEFNGFFVVNLYQHPGKWVADSLLDNLLRSICDYFFTLSSRRALVRELVHHAVENHRRKKRIREVFRAWKQILENRHCLVRQHRNMTLKRILLAWKRAQRVKSMYRKRRLCTAWRGLKFIVYLKRESEYTLDYLLNDIRLVTMVNIICSEKTLVSTPVISILKELCYKHNSDERFTHSLNILVRILQKTNLFESCVGNPVEKRTLYNFQNNILQGTTKFSDRLRLKSFWVETHYIQMLLLHTVATIKCMIMIRKDFNTDKNKYEEMYGRMNTGQRAHCVGQLHLMYDHYMAHSVESDPATNPYLQHVTKWRDSYPEYKPFAGLIPLGILKYHRETLKNRAVAK